MRMKLDALQLKMIAIITMFIDHFIKAVLKTGIYLYRIPSTPWYIIYRGITTLMRIGYPLFIFLQVEGFFHTSDKKKYLMRLLLFAFISQLAYNMFLSANAEDIHTAWTLSSLLRFSPLNILFTLVLSFICIWITDELLIEHAISGMTMLEQDPHTNYFSLEQAEAFSQALAGSNVGVGISYSVDDNNNLLIHDIFVGSGADNAGLQKGDVITAVDSLVCSETA